MSRNHHIICLPHHASKIIDGKKTTTIRSSRSRQIAVGDTITFSRWTAKPYRSKKKPVRVVTVTSVDSIRVKRQTRSVYVGEKKQPAFIVEQMATNDGFCGTWELVDYLTSDNQLEFTGFIYGWEG